MAPQLTLYQGDEQRTFGLSLELATLRAVEALEDLVEVLEPTDTIRSAAVIVADRLACRLPADYDESA